MSLGSFEPHDLKKGVGSTGVGPLFTLLKTHNTHATLKEPTGFIVEKLREKGSGFSE